MGCSSPNESNSMPVVQGKQTEDCKSRLSCRNSTMRSKVDRCAPADIAAHHVVRGMVPNTAVPEQISRVPTGLASPTYTGDLGLVQSKSLHSAVSVGRGSPSRLCDYWHPKRTGFTKRHCELWILSRDCGLRSQETVLHQQTLRLPHVLRGMISNTAVREQMSPIPNCQTSPTNTACPVLSTEKTWVHHKTVRDWIPLQGLYLATPR